MDYRTIERRVAQEFDTATDLYPLFHSPHEGYAVLLEEVVELQREVFQHHTTRSTYAMTREAVQVAAVAIKFIASLQ